MVEFRVEKRWDLHVLVCIADLLSKVFGIGAFVNETLRVVYVSIHGCTTFLNWICWICHIEEYETSSAFGCTRSRSNDVCKSSIVAGLSQSQSQLANTQYDR